MSWPKGPWVADTSAWARAGVKEVAPQWREVVKAGELVACPPVTMEMIFDAPDRDAVERVAVAMAGFHQAPISRSVTDAATWAMRELAQRGAAGDPSGQGPRRTYRRSSSGEGIRGAALRPPLRHPRNRPRLHQPVGRAGRIDRLIGREPGCARRTAEPRPQGGPGGPRLQVRRRPISARLRARCRWPARLVG